MEYLFGFLSNLLANKTNVVFQKVSTVEYVLFCERHDKSQKFIII